MNATQKPAKARKKPVEIEFMLWEGGADAATPIIDWVLSNDGIARYHDSSYEPLGECIAIKTLEGLMRATPGDIVIRGVNGEFYPCKPDIFRKTYDVEGLGEY